MPELPEVETVKLGLQKYLVGHKILDIEVKVAKIFQGNKKNLIGAKITNIERIGKGLIIELDNGYSLTIHLKLTGQLIYQGKETQKVHLSIKTGGVLPSKYSHVIFTLDKGGFLYFNDLRKFGWIKVVKKDEIRNLPFFKEMGPEPLVASSSGQAKKLTLESFYKIVQSSNTPIKLLIMDQKKIGGIGNIYANEALFLAGIDPRRKAKSLNQTETKKLFKSIIEVLQKALKYGGSSDVHFVNATGEEGEYQNHFLVYGQKGKKCQKGKGVIQKIQLGGRGTYFCPACQN